MFYKVLFILAIINFVREINRYFKEYKAVQTKTGNTAAQTDVPVELYIKVGVSALFYIMVLALCAMPRLLWW